MSGMLRISGAVVLSTAIILMLAACGGGASGNLSLGGSSGSTTTDCTHPTRNDQNACLYTGITDADGQFDAYIVTVDSITLTRLDGTVVNLLPNSAQVDFSQYTDLAEFLSLQTVPPGTYIKGSMVLDYSNADIEVDVNGVATPATAMDASGNPITKLTVAINLASGNSLTLVPGVPQLFGLDFDLSASNLVDTSGTTPVVTVSPVLYAQVDANSGKTLQLRGPLASVDANNDEFALALRPFYARSGNFGSPAVHVTSSTTYLINMQSYTGEAGLAALSAAGATTAVLARGTFDFTSNEFVASEVDAGSSVPGGILDAVEGVVTAVNGNTLTVRGATLIRAQQSAVFRDNVTVTDDANTIVREQGSTATSFTTGDISVGQHMLFMGTLTNTNAASLALDVTGGFALLKHTRIGATVNSIGTGDLNLNVQSLQGRPVSLFDFTGTGSNPASYLVNTGSLSLSGIASGDPVLVSGFVAPFGAAPPDFTAASIADYQAANAHLVVGYVLNGGTTAPFVSLDASAGMVIDMSNTAIGTAHFVRQGPVFTNLTSALNPTIKPAASVGLYAIKQANGSLQLYVTFSGFVTALQSDLNGSAKVEGVFASGAYDQATGIMTADRIAVVFQ
ncbi:MAG TPA: DUF4382 domain-containing protein [Gammaproteobacteria bacterium]